MTYLPADRNYIIAVSIAIIFILIIGAGLIYILAQPQSENLAENGSQSPAGEVTIFPTSSPTPTLQSNTAPESSLTTSSSQSSPTNSPTLSTSSTPKTTEVSIRSSGFSPSSITIRQNETVCFVNNDSLHHWPSSNDHPTHTIYSEFDPKKAVKPGDRYCFNFERVGTWKYHDHLNPSSGGSITVTHP